jgi:hypothetical protein
VREQLAVADRGARLVERGGDLRGRLGPYGLGQQLDGLDPLAEPILHPQRVDPVLAQRALEARRDDRASAKERDPVRARRRQVAGQRLAAGA